ncbi:hypothetical protein [Cohnella abietis]|uniref:Uncharacterized protein n=1 Tax=Cohnella abietis TaxID=2507935 RepID=A0A3T1DAL0_9BACL|nr:hypothetical protein [Cohnella abietis]BBI35156.1 hypothetical protein KCTCHS21_45550 [Cohnella abietis]
MRTLYRPVGLFEMKLILDLNLKGFPPRLSEQPIFYPVLNKPYADQIAREWNTKDKFSGYVGFVTEFDVASPYIDQFEDQVVGNSHHNELWIPAEEMEELNSNIIGQIKIVDVFYGQGYEGLTQRGTIFDAKNPIEQFLILKDIYEKNDFKSEIKGDWQTIFLNFPLWSRFDFTSYGISHKEKAQILLALKRGWSELFSNNQLFGDVDEG